MLPNVKLLSLGGKRLTPTVLDLCLYPDMVMQTIIVFVFADLLILEYADHHQI